EIIDPVGLASGHDVVIDGPHFSARVFVFDESQGRHAVSYGQSSTLSGTICAMRKILLLTLILAAPAAAIDQNDVEFAKPGGVSMTLDLRVPDGKGPVPAAIIVHGGSFSHGNKRTYV